MGYLQDLSEYIRKHYVDDIASIRERFPEVAVNEEI